MAEAWELDLFRPSDAQGVADLYRSVYGEDYHVKSIYDPVQLIAMQDSGEAYRAVARTTAGEVIGHTAFYRSSPPNKELYEVGQLLVRHDWRGSKVAIDLSRFAMDKIPCQFHLQQVWGEAVCNHVFTQRKCRDTGFAETGLEVDLLPGEAMAQSMDGINTGRVSAVVVFKAYGPSPQTIYLPSVYERQLTFAYIGFDHGHTFAAGNQPLPSEAVTAGKLDLLPGAAVARMTFGVVGCDFAACLADYDRQAGDSAMVVYQVFLPLTAPCTGAAVVILRQHGYFFGGVMPRWFGDDALFMQKISGQPNFSNIRLYTTRAKEILALVQDDWQAVTKANAVRVDV